jgi:hypothetical protein
MVEASDLILQQSDLPLEMMLLVERRLALACSGATQPADEMHDLVFFAAADLVDGREQFDNDFVRFA